MKTEYVNSKNLPDPIFKAIEKTDFLPLENGISTSRLCDAPQIAALKQANKITEDITDRVWMLIHRGMLHILEQGSESQSIYRSAQTLYRAMSKKIAEIKSHDANDPQLQTLENIPQLIAAFARENYPLDKERWVIKQTLGVKVPFTIDQTDATGAVTDQLTLERTVFDSIHLYDKQEEILYLLKLCPVSTAYKPHMRTQWEREANVQAYILHHNNFPVKAAHVLMVFKDFSEAQKNKVAKYPSEPMQEISINLDSLEKIDIFIKGRLRKHAAAEGGEMPECTAEDRWATADEFAVVRPGSDRYVIKKGMATAEGAREWMDNNVMLASGCTIDIIPGQSRRCESYCPVRHVCPQWARELQKMKHLQSQKK